MTILQLIKKSAILLNVDDVVKDVDAYIDSEIERTVLMANENVNKFFHLAQIVITEVEQKVPRITDRLCSSYKNKINFSAVDTTLDRILSVEDEEGNPVHFEAEDGFIIVDKDGYYTVKYTCEPNIASINNDIDVCRKSVNEDLLVWGLSAYYSLSVGLYNEFNVYHERYLDGLSRVNKLKLFALPCRSWHG